MSRAALLIVDCCSAFAAASAVYLLWYAFTTGMWVGVLPG